MFTVWLVRSPSTGEERLIVRSAHPDDYRHQHEYQRIRWTGEARNPADALRIAQVNA